MVEEVYQEGVIYPQNKRNLEDSGERLYIEDDCGSPVKGPIQFKIIRPTKEDGTVWDQTLDAANNLRYAASLDIPRLVRRRTPRQGKAIIVGGAPSIKDHLETIREFAKNPFNGVFAINWSHTWLIQNGIIPRGCVLFEIDVEPDTVLKAAHPDVTYFICAHCHPTTFDSLKNFKRALWFTPPLPDTPYAATHTELGLDEMEQVGGGVSTFTRSMSVALFLGYRDFELFGCDSSYPDTGETHVEGYETNVKDDVDGMWVYAKHPNGTNRRFRTAGYLAMQQAEFVEYCEHNHQTFTLRVHGDSLLRYTHEALYPEQYESK